MARRRRTTSGFTLIELLMVMAVLAIVVALAAPNLFNFAMGRRVFDEATHVVAIANYARTQAISEGRPYRLNFDQGGTMWLTAPDDNGQFSDITDPEFGAHVTPPDGIRLEVTLPKQPDGGMYVIFLPTGRCQPATIVVRDNNGGSVTVTCDSPTEVFHTVGGKA